MMIINELLLQITPKLFARRCDMPLKSDLIKDKRPCHKAMKRMTNAMARKECIELEICPDCGHNLEHHFISEKIEGQRCFRCNKFYI